MKKVSKKVLSKVNTLVRKNLKLEFQKKISKRMMERAVEESLHATPLDLALAIEMKDIFCEKCGECCRKNDPIAVDMEDLTALSSYLGVYIKMIIASYTKQLLDGSLSLQTPCPFLQDDSLCSVYLSRPRICKFFPFVTEGGHITLGSYPYCQFTTNLLAHKTIGLLLRWLMKVEQPDLYDAIKEGDRKLEKLFPKTQQQKIMFAQKLIQEQGENLRKRRREKKNGV